MFYFLVLTLLFLSPFRNLHRKAQSKEEVGPAVEQQLKESQEREQEMNAHIQRLESQLERQQSQIESNENAMKELNQRLLEIQQERSSTAGRQRRRRSAQLLGSSQVSPSSGSTDEDGEIKRGRSRFCSVM
jgi:peptidoglycan hydrolase CwlO-like protein